MATLAIGIAASFLAYRQYKISRAKLKFDLYEKRLELFTTLRDFMSEVAVGDFNSSFESAQKVTKFYHQTLEHWFLFEDPAINTYFDKVLGKARELRMTLQKLDDQNLTDKDRKELQERDAELVMWFFTQTEEVVNVFKNDLSIKTLR